MAGENAIPGVSLEDILEQVRFRDESLEIVFTDQRRVVCDGPGGALGHPRVWYTVGDEGYAECGYCDRVFVFDPARKGQHMDAATLPAPLKRDGITESATPPPGEILGTGGDSGA